ncbi:MAG: nitrogenase cofactor biosynthesis protein NifB [Terracidiphilus sp.]|nr:nitrogenase cofactor biosynthesis protein NifB [Terracidiphilus sp.]
MKALTAIDGKQRPEGFLHHPCFNQEARHSYARIHLPVAPRCNMQCNYCNRKYSCVNESRPGVTCAVLKPGQAIEYLRRFIEKVPHLSVVGIAGPGDPMACASETLETLRMVKAEFPHLLLCLATNGLNLPPYVADLAAIGLSHITLTVNAVEPTLAARFYQWIEIDGKHVSGPEATAELWRRQQESICAMAAAGLAVKVNTIYVPGINDQHIDEVAKTVSVLGATVLNIMPLLPTAGTPFGAIPEPDRKTLQNARTLAAHYLPQMAHCARCRADAAGMLGEDNAQHQQLLQSIASAPEPVATPGLSASPAASELPLNASADRPYIAVASRDGAQIDQHLGEACSLRIYRADEQGGSLIEVREISREAEGSLRWLRMVDRLIDCSAVLVSGAGAMPRKILMHYGLAVHIVDGSVQEALQAVATGGDLSFMAKQNFSCNEGSCHEDRTGCQ